MGAGISRLFVSGCRFRSSLNLILTAGFLPGGEDYEADSGEPRRPMPRARSRKSWVEAASQG